MHQILQISQQGKPFYVDLEWTGRLSIFENEEGRIQFDTEPSDTPFKVYDIKFEEVKEWKEEKLESGNN